MLVLEACFSLLAMFDVLFYLLHVFLHDRINASFEEEQVHNFEVKESTLSLEKGK
jgi:hypothetical protein